jgi:hypothetical protein
MQEHMQDEDVNPIPSLMNEEDGEWAKTIALNKVKALQSVRTGRSATLR